ncbi:MAG: hypothetical protein IBJ10_02025 [Phycisphaerales bacterium]|nr:hypothetical protein [Phycisphaerales bacterium]
MSPNRRGSSEGWRRGFSLVELLVILGVVGLLIALALPALRGASQASRRVACLANLKSLHLATRMYAEEHKGMLPLATTGVWIGIGDIAPLGDLVRYLDVPIPREVNGEMEGLSGPYLCPSDREFAVETGFSYGYQPWVFMAIEGQEPVSRRYTANPRLVLFGERGTWHPGEPIPSGWENRPGGSNAVNFAGELDWNLTLQAAAMQSLQ